MSYGGGLNQTARDVLTVSTTAVSLTLPAAPHGNPKHVLIYVANAPIRWRADGTAPTSTTGMYVAANTYLEFIEPLWDYRSIITRIQFIRDTTAGADSTLEIAFFN